MAFGFIKRIFKKKPSQNSINQSITSINQSLQSINQSEDSINQSLDQKKSSDNEDITLQKDSLGVGIAAGYATHSLRTIEASIDRLETLVVTKEWLTSNFNNLIADHDSNEQNRFENLRVCVSARINSCMQIRSMADFQH